LLVGEIVFEKLSEQKAPEGIVTVAGFIEGRHREIDTRDVRGYCAGASERVLVAESLRDPGNLGTVIRSCAALGIDRLIISDDCADLYNPKTIRGAMGGLFRLNIDVVPTDDMPVLIRALRSAGRRVFAAALHTEALTIGELELRASDCFVISNEGHGLSESVIEACDSCAIIPMIEGSESLNAAAAAAICIWETVRAK
jgi:TrmH family RNA methyltransferase